MRENVAPMSFMAHNTSIALTSARPWDESVMKSYEKLVYIVTVRQKGRLIYLLWQPVRMITASPYRQLRVPVRRLPYFREEPVGVDQSTRPRNQEVSTYCFSVCDLKNVRTRNMTASHTSRGPQIGRLLRQDSQYQSNCTPVLSAVNKFQDRSNRMGNTTYTCAITSRSSSSTNDVFILH